MTEEPTKLQPPAERTEGQAAAAQIARSLRMLREAIRVHLLWTRGGLIVAALAAVVLLVGLLDYAVGLPMGVRVILWIASVAGLLLAAKKWLLPAARFSTPLSALALRVEESEQGKRAGWKHRLAAAIELGGEEGASAGSPTLRAAALQDLAQSLANSKIQISGLIERATAVRAVGALALALGVAATCLIVQPSLTRIALARSLTPWRDVQWPKATAVALVPSPKAHARGTPIALRALLLRSNKPASQQRITADVRVLIDGTVESQQRVVLAHQATKDTIDISGAQVQGDVFERLLDTQPLIPPTTPATANVVLEVSVSTSDDTTPVTQVRLVEPPRVLSVKAQVTPPAYIASLLAARSDAQPLDNLSRVLLTGEQTLVDRDVNAARTSGPLALTLGPVLADSQVSLTLTFDQPMPALTEESLQAVAPGIAALAPEHRPQLASADRSWTLAWNASANYRSALLPVGSDGIAARDETGFRIEVVDDLSPTANVTLPSSDESVLATAVIPTRVAAKDDVSLASLQAFVQPAAATQSTEAANSDAAAQEPKGRTLLGSVEAGEALASTLAVEASVDLSQLGAKPGDEFWVLAAAKDRKGAIAEAAAIESSIRRLSVITESELVSQVASEMASLRDAASRLEAEQARLQQLREQANQQMQQASTQAQAQQSLSQQAGAQGTVSQRAKQLEQKLEAIAGRLERNQLDDDALKGLVQDAKETAQQAASSSSMAQQSLKSLSEQPRDASVRDQMQETARDEQTASQEALADLASMLDTKQDDWSVKRELERILTEQRQLRAQTQTAGSRTQGQQQSELSREDRDELERIARRQQDLSQRTRESLQALDARADQLKAQSPEQAKTMQDAAQQAREGQASALQEQASKQIRENRTGQAQQAQANAEQALEQALKKLDDVQQARDEQLQRTLADLMQSLDALIASQQAALEQLAPVLAGDAGTTPAQLAQGMMALQRNTLGTITRLKADEREARTLEAVIDHLQSASDSQAGAIVVLRAPDADLGEADRQERTSLQRLEDAKAEAQKLQEESEDRQQQRKREELREKYEQMLEQHLQAQVATKELVGQEATRRTRAAARQIGQQQKLVREGLAQIRSDTAELAEAKVFDFAHTRLEQLLTRAGEQLEQGNANASVVSDQSTVTAILSSLVEALRSDRDKQDDLQDGGGGQDGQPPPLVPPLAELVLLRGMQAEANARTAAQGEMIEKNAGAADALAPEIAQTAELQQQLADLAQQLLEALQEDNAPGGPANEGKPEEQKPEAAEDNAEEDKADGNKPAPKEQNT